MTEEQKAWQEMSRADYFTLVLIGILIEKGCR